jgi:F0F1-type ATP synthase delta subunit
MKIKPKIYAKLLLESIDHPDRQKLVANFWQLLQKNKQQKELPKILDELENLFAKKNGLIIANIESGVELAKPEVESIKQRLLDSSPLRGEAGWGGKTIIVKSKVNSSLHGIIAKIGDQTIDLTLENKIGCLRKQLKI